VVVKQSSVALADSADVPYGRDVARWEDPQPLPRDYKYPADKEYVVDGLYCAQPNRAYTLQSE
jgi:hypothetical protein